MRRPKGGKAVGKALPARRIAANIAKLPELQPKKCGACAEKDFPSHFYAGGRPAQVSLE
jgi:hypothetical protein